MLTKESSPLILNEPFILRMSVRLSLSEVEGVVGFTSDRVGNTLAEYCKVCVC